MQLDTADCVLAIIVFCAGLAALFLGILQLFVRSPRPKKWWEKENLIEPLTEEEKIKERDSWRTLQ